MRRNGRSKQRAGAQFPGLFCFVFLGFNEAVRLRKNFDADRTAKLVRELLIQSVRIFSKIVLLKNKGIWHNFTLLTVKKHAFSGEEVPLPREIRRHGRYAGAGSGETPFPQATVVISDNSVSNKLKLCLFRGGSSAATGDTPAREIRRHGRYAGVGSGETYACQALTFSARKGSEPDWPRFPQE